MRYLIHHFSNDDRNLIINYQANRVRYYFENKIIYTYYFYFFFLD